MSDNISTGSSSVPLRADGDLQLQLKALAPLKNARPHASRAASAAPGDALKHILDSVPFTPSQGVRTPSPRRPNVRNFNSYVLTRLDVMQRPDDVTWRSSIIFVWEMLCMGAGRLAVLLRKHC